jgi:hypothetical protein
VGKAEDYRKRATGLVRSMKGRRKSARKSLADKQKALRNLADNEDWLDGKPGTSIYPDKK